MLYASKLPVLFALILAGLTASVQAADMFVYIGTHGKGPHLGFSLAHFDTDTGKLTAPVFWQEAVAPAYFIIRPDGKRLYTCNSAPGSSISAYAIDPKTAKLTFLNQQPSCGGDPSYLCFDATGHYIFVANYQGGSIAAYALLPDGSLGARTAFDQHTGHSVNPDNQTQARAHSIHVDPSNRFVLAADLGVDRVYVYRLDPKTGALTPNDPPFAAVPPGSGPRHMAFSKDGRFLYLANQMGSNIMCFSWDSTRGVLTPFATVSTLPPDFKGVSTCAEILVHPGGKFVYVTNRGIDKVAVDNVAVFSVETATGRLKLIQNIPTHGKIPRNCDFDPTGRWLLVTNQDSGSAVVFRIDPDTGLLTQTGEPVLIAAPFCERFLPVEK